MDYYYLPDSKDDIPEQCYLRIADLEPHVDKEHWGSFDDAWRWAVATAIEFLSWEIAEEFAANKPVTNMGVIAKLEELKELSRGRQPKRIKYGPDPERQGIIYWDFEARKVTPISWKFLRAVWGKHGVTFADIGESVWGDDMTSPSTIRARASNTSKELAESDVDLQFSTDGEKVSPLTEWPG